MSLKRHLKKVLPPSAVKALRAIVPAPEPDPFAPFKLGAKAVAEARARWPFVTWPSDARPRAIYALTPTASLRNVGDQAQVVAIERWLARHYPDHPVVELDKNLVLGCIEDMKRRVTPRDFIFLHSGGNLGDRGRWSEAARRAMIEAFPDNRIVSLPQTIFFSDTPLGRHERDVSRAIYGRHPHLTVMGRDEISGRLAAELFPRAQIATMPDFVLSLKAEDFKLSPDPVHAERIMLCLRQDDESAFERDQRLALMQVLGRPATLYDTTLDHDIPAAHRTRILTETLSLFSGHQAVVTDRFHGLIFAILCRKPAVVLPTVDHKLTSAIAWFKDIANVQLCADVAEVPDLLRHVLSTPMTEYPDFNRLYFDQLPDLLARWPRSHKPA
ncbi:MAG TPA: polysaccharide pyruvyl transferase family protein [Dongiaceae bacterium]|nr:polysaccharide pyruvyl transferase family protein [Dongiaceae bacterium]